MGRFEFRVCRGIASRWLAVGTPAPMRSHPATSRDEATSDGAPDVFRVRAGVGTSASRVDARSTSTTGMEWSGRHDRGSRARGHEEPARRLLAALGAEISARFRKTACRGERDGWVSPHRGNNILAAAGIDVARTDRDDG